MAFADRRVLTYIWDTTAPKGMMANASSIPVLRVFAVVCQSGAAALNRWITESHNVAADYELGSACERHLPSSQFSPYRHQRRELFRRSRIP